MPSKSHRLNHQEYIVSLAQRLGQGLHIKACTKTGLIAIIAIDSTQRGPALGGCRCLPYDSFEKALDDATRLAQGMTLKAAALSLPMGGGKTVLMCPPKIADRHAYFAAFGQFVDTLGGLYITAIDSGTAPADMDIVAQHTRHVTCTSSSPDLRQTDPSPFTAKGVLRGIAIAAKHQFGHQDLGKLSFAVQGAGHVGYFIIQALATQGAEVFVSDTNATNLARVVSEFRVTPVTTTEIYQQKADVFVPCALGGILNHENISKLKVTVVAGSANNQLQSLQDAKELAKRGILYAPDFAINSGGLIAAIAQYLQWSPATIDEKIEHIPQLLDKIFAKALTQKCSTAEIAENIARENLT